MTKIAKFNHELFGSLTTLKNEKTGKIMFIGNEIIKLWGHTNLSVAIKSSKLLKDEFTSIDLSKFPEFKNQLFDNNLISNKTNRVILLTESGVYKLILSSKLEKAHEFKNWLAGEVLPSIRETGSYQLSGLTSKEIGMNTKKTIQLQNSKAVNSKNFQEGGIIKTIDYNRKNCKQVTGMEPKDIRKKAGVKSKSAKEILRETNPELAATMSLNDHLVIDKGAKLEELVNVDKAAINLFKELSKMGFRLID